jgi:pimeloyl-ACP methyl ester carboxylesterase
MTAGSKLSRRALLAAGAGICGLASCKLIDGPVCEAPTVNGVNWIPDVMRPVSWGIDYVGPATGAPRSMMIAYPSAVRPGDNSNARALTTGSANVAPHDLTLGAEITDEQRPILRHCLTRWPLVLLMHGGDDVLPLEGRHLYWRTMASALACSGCVVVASNWNSTLALNNVELAAAQAWEDAEWVRTQWRHAWWVDPQREETLFVGHSLGARVALTLAVDQPDCAGVASLGGWQLSNDGLPWQARIWAELRAPVLFMRTRWSGNERFFEDRWTGLPGDKYELIYAGDHFDYLDRLPYVQREPGLGAGPQDRPGACSVFTGFAAGLVSLFAARYLRAETVPAASLEPPDVTLTPAQLRYNPGPAGVMFALDAAPGCDLRMRWVVGGQSGARTLAVL